MFYIFSKTRITPQAMRLTSELQQTAAAVYTTRRPLRLLVFPVSYAIPIEFGSVQIVVSQPKKNWFKPFNSEGCCCWKDMATTPRYL
jgi:hypothetical protein